MRVLVCGSRDWSDGERIRAELNMLYTNTVSTANFTVIEGGARGADTFANLWALEMRTRGTHVKHEQFPADWRKYGRRAGYVRNAEMLAKGKPDLVLAFWDGRSPGTRMMIELAEKAGIPVRVIRAEGEE